MIRLGLPNPIFSKLKFISARFAEHELKGMVLLEKEKLATIATTLQKNSPQLTNA
jgi:hypothetical protein